jgi:hypothetical protein
MNGRSRTNSQNASVRARPDKACRFLNEQKLFERLQQMLDAKTHP